MKKRFAIPLALIAAPFSLTAPLLLIGSFLPSAPHKAEAPKPATERPAPKPQTKMDSDIQEGKALLTIAAGEYEAMSKTSDVERACNHAWRAKQLFLQGMELINPHRAALPDGEVTRIAADVLKPYALADKAVDICIDQDYLL